MILQKNVEDYPNYFPPLWSLHDTVFNVYFQTSCSLDIFHFFPYVIFSKLQMSSILDHCRCLWAGFRMQLLLSANTCSLGHLTSIWKKLGYEPMRSVSDTENKFRMIDKCTVKVIRGWGIVLIFCNVNIYMYLGYLQACYVR